MTPPDRLRIALAEGIGTFVLMLGGPGSAVLATGGFFGDGSIGVLGVALAFGLSLLVMAYAIGNVSGCHINPAVTIGLLVTRRIDLRLFPAYLAGQVAGALMGGLAIWAIASGATGGFAPTPANFAVNGWGALSPGGFGFGAMALTEILMTALLVFVVLSTTHRQFAPAAGGLAVGLTLTLIHLVSIPIDNTSVNPARSLGMAAFAGGSALAQLWAFIVFPVLGAVLGAVAWNVLDPRGHREPQTVPADATAVDPGAVTGPSSDTSRHPDRSPPDGTSGTAGITRDG